MNILIIGFGSIGRKHYDNLKKLGEKKVFVFDVDRKRTEGLSAIKNLSQSELEKFDAVFVCNPTNSHVETAIKCAQAGCHVFIEKPLSDNLKDIEKLKNICRKNKLISMVGCNMRFDPAIKKIKNLLDKKFLGEMYAIYLEYGRYLPYQRPAADYRKVYAASKKMGGGVILDDIHDFDLLFWLNDFSKLRKVAFVHDKLSGLKMDVEDFCNATLVFNNNVVGNIRCDYLQQYKHRNIKIIGEKGNLLWDFRENIVWFEYYENGKEKRKKILSAGKYDPSRMLREEIKYFLFCVKNKQATFNSVADAGKVLSVVIKGKKSSSR